MPNPVIQQLAFQPFTQIEIAGLLFGAGILAAAASAPRVDSFIARSQRKTLGLCLECGGVHKLPCKKCRGRGEVATGPLGELRNIGGPLAMLGQAERTTCAACGGTGQLACPSCK
eukprot:jgi/Mesen1/1502/ME000132S00446